MNWYDYTVLHLKSLKEVKQKKKHENRGGERTRRA